MAETATTIPGTDQRKRAQRERILAAAQKRFICSGFHSASMATIAETAGMSPGLIYRYFANKNAIILAIIEQQLKIAQRRIRDMRSTDDLCSGILDYFEAHDTEEDGAMSAALFLEIAAEATRDPEIARAFSRFDEAVRAELVEWFCRGNASNGYSLDNEAARQRALSLTILIEGLKVRKARQPLLERGLLKNAIEGLLGTLER